MCSWVEHPLSELSGTDFTVWLVCVPSCDEGEPCTLVKLGPVRDAGLGMLFIMAIWCACFLLGF